MRFLIVFLTFLLLGVGSVTGATVYSNAYPANGSTVYTNVINYSVTYVGIGDVVNASNVSISLDKTTYTNYTSTAVTNSTSNYYIDGQDTNTGLWIYYRWYLGNGTDDPENANASGIYRYKISRLYALNMTFNSIVGMMGSFLSVVVWAGIIILLIGVVGMLKGMFKNLGGTLNFGKLR